MEDVTCNAKRNAMSLVKIQNSIKIKIVMPAVASRVDDRILWNNFCDLYSMY